GGNCGCTERGAVGWRDARQPHQPPELPCLPELPTGLFDFRRCWTLLGVRSEAHRCQTLMHLRHSRRLGGAVKSSLRSSIVVRRRESHNRLATSEVWTVSARKR